MILTPRQREDIEKRIGKAFVDVVNALVGTYSSRIEEDKQSIHSDRAALMAENSALLSANKELRKEYWRLNESICQILGKALGYPWYKDDQVNFPGATEANGVCVGDHVAESIADEAAKALLPSIAIRQAPSVEQP